MSQFVVLNTFVSCPSLHATVLCRFRVYHIRTKLEARHQQLQRDEPA